MSFYVLMKILESAPARYDRGLRWLTRGRLAQAYARLTARVQPGQRVLDIGCGTGALTLLAAARGARVKGIDVNAAMLEQAHRKARAAGLDSRIEFREMGVGELGGETGGDYDAVLSGLCFSELTEEELTFALRETRRILKPGGLLLVADEVKARGRVKRCLQAVLRFPLVLVTYLATQATTRPIADLPERISGAGFVLLSQESGALGGLMEVAARKA